MNAENIFNNFMFLVQFLYLSSAYTEITKKQEEYIITGERITDVFNGVWCFTEIRTQITVVGSRYTSFSRSRVLQR